jgi:hypothetical protein
MPEFAHINNQYSNSQGSSNHDEEYKGDWIPMDQHQIALSNLKKHHAASQSTLNPLSTRKD